MKTVPPALPPAWTASSPSHSTANGWPPCWPRPPRPRWPRETLALQASQPPQRHFLHQVAPALAQDQVRTLPRRQNVVMQIDEIDALPDRCGGVDSFLIGEF